MYILKKGDKFRLHTTSKFGKKFFKDVQVIAIIQNRVLLDNGEEYHINQINI